MPAVMQASLDASQRRSGMPAETLQAARLASLEAAQPGCLPAARQVSLEAGRSGGWQAGRLVSRDAFQPEGLQVGRLASLEVCQQGSRPACMLDS